MAVLGSASPNEVEVPANASVTSVSAVPESPLQITAKDDSTLCSQHDAEKGTDVGKAESIVSTQQASTSDLEHSNQTATNPPTEPECTYSTLSPSPGHVLRRHETMFSSKPQLLSAASWKPQTYQSWRSPILMIMLFLVGFAFSVGHCIFYPSLNGKIVGDSSQQEGKLRIGTAFSSLSQLALTSSVWKSYTQWLWRAVYNNTNWTAAGLDNAFGLDATPSSLLNRNLIKNFKLGAAIALFAWLLVLPSFFTPAALFIYSSTELTRTDESVPYLAIANSTAGSEFSYSPPISSNTLEDANDTSLLFSGPRTILPLLVSATASQGEILPLTSPSNHSAYSLSFYGPIMQCQDAHETTKSSIDRLLQQYMERPRDGAHQIDSAYFGFVPATNSTGDLVALSEPRYWENSNATNELWMTFQRYTFTGGSRGRVREQQVCRLHNATYNLELQWNNGFQNITGSYDVGEEVDYPHDRLGKPTDRTNHAYAAVMWTLADQLVGSFGWFRKVGSSANDTVSELAAQFGVIESPIGHTSVVGSSDLDIFFDFGSIYELFQENNETDLNPQRLQDKALARNRTLAVLVEELSFNAAISLLHNKLLTYNTTREVSHWKDVNRYGYIATSLFIPYALGNLVAFIAVVIGMVSFLRHGTFPDKTFREIVKAATDARIARITSKEEDSSRKKSNVSQDLNAFRVS